MSTAITSTKEIEFNKKLKIQLRLNDLLILSNVVIWLAAIFLLSSCGSPVHPTRHPSLDKGEYTSLQCLKISKAKRSFAKRPVTSRMNTVSIRPNTKRH